MKWLAWLPTLTFWVCLQTIAPSESFAQSCKTALSGSISHNLLHSEKALAPAIEQFMTEIQPLYQNGFRAKNPRITVAEPIGRNAYYIETKVEVGREAPSLLDGKETFAFLVTDQRVSSKVIRASGDEIFFNESAKEQLVEEFRLKSLATPRRNFFNRFRHNLPWWARVVESKADEIDIDLFNSSVRNGRIEYGHAEALDSKGNVIWSSGAVPGRYREIAMGLIMEPILRGMFRDKNLASRVSTLRVRHTHPYEHDFVTTNSRFSGSDLSFDKDGIKLFTKLGWHNLNYESWIVYKDKNNEIRRKGLFMKSK